jgi:hypothetical protein
MTSVRTPRVLGRTLLVRLALGAALVAPVALADPATAPTDLAAALREPLPDSEYVDAKRCVSKFLVEHTEILDARRIVFRGRNGRVWLNQLRHLCIGLTGDPILSFDLHGTSICRSDLMRPIERRGGAAPGGPCVLGDFEPVTDAQLEVIRESLAQARVSLEHAAPALETKP